MTRRILLALGAIAILAACSSDPAGPNMPSVLDGLIESVARDTLGNPPPAPPTPTPTGSGEIHGTVLGQSEPGGVIDTLETAPRIVGATITVYPVLDDSPLELDDPVATVTTGADGKFETPALDAGEYVITVEPPASQAATYHGQWIRGFIHGTSFEHPWWVVLAER